MGGFTALPLDILTIIPCYLPLSTTPSTVLALALTSHDAYKIFRHILYSRMILRNEDDALNMVQRILVDSELGKTVRELYIGAELSAETLRGEKSDVVFEMKRAIEAGLLLNIHTLDIDLTLEWYDFGPTQRPAGFGQLDRNFWIALRRECPLLRGVHLSGVIEDPTYPWIVDSGIYELDALIGLTTFGLLIHAGSHSSGLKLLSNIHLLSSSLHTLALNLGHDTVTSASPILCLHFPYLRTLDLRLSFVVDTAEAMIFWQHHPTLERLRLVCDASKVWFSNDVGPGLLPNLKYLHASYNIVRALTPVLHRLVSLSIQNPIKAQVAYLLRSILPNGLPQLKSLAFSPNYYATEQEIANAEGAMWDEPLDRQFKTKERGKQGTGAEYLHSIVKSVPNLEELCILTRSYSLDEKILEIGPDLSRLARLERFSYYSDFNKVDRIAFCSISRKLAETCKRLRLVKDISSDTSAKIRRSEDGKIEAEPAYNVCSLQMGYEDDPLF